MLKRLTSFVRKSLSGPETDSEYPAKPYQDAELETLFPGKRVDYVETPVGRYVVPADAGGDVIVKAMKSGKVFEQEIVDLAKRHIVPGTVVLDVGSNLGQMATQFALAAGPSGKVQCFEANDFIYQLLCRNLKQNGATNAIPNFCAVWDSSETELFFPDPDFKRFESYGSYGLDPKAKQGKRVPARRIDDMDLGGKVSFIKVDIQGSDIFAMRGARDTIKRDKPIIIFEFEKQFQKEFGTSFKDYTDFIDEIGYEVIETINKINFVIGPRKA
jgi:FkbM family methyltransferase